MSLKVNELDGILKEIRAEIANQISLANTVNEKINIKTLVQKAHDLDKVIATSGLSEEDKLMLQEFSTTLVQDNTTVKSLRYEKQDLERVLSNLNDT